MTGWQIALSGAATIAALFVVVRSVCQLNLMDAKTPAFVFAFYLADAIGGALVLFLPIIELRAVTLAEAAFVIGAAIAFLFDHHRRGHIVGSQT